MKKFYSLVAAALLLPASALAEGINIAGATQLFDKNISEYYATDFRNTHVSLAACGKLLVLNFGDGTTPILSTSTHRPARSSEKSLLALPMPPGR